MEITENKIDELTREFKVAVSAADLDAKLNGRITELSKTMNIKGFRPGKVPVSVIRRRYGEAIRGEILEQTINDTSTEVIKERGLRPALSPQFEITPPGDDGSLEYTMSVELLPEIPSQNFSDIELDKQVVTVSDDDVEQAIQRLADVVRPIETVSEARAARDGDLVTIDFTAPEEGQSPLPVTGDGQGVSVELSENSFPPGLGEQLSGVSVGETKSVTLEFPQDYPVSELAGGTATYDVTMKEIKEKGEAPAGDELAKKIGVATLDELRTSVREHRENELKGLSRQHLKRALLDCLAERNTFDVPNGLVKREYEQVIKQMAPETPQAETHDDHDHDHSHDHDHDHSHDHDHDHSHDHDHDHSHDHDHDHDHDHAHDQVSDDHLSEEQRTEYRGLAERRVRLGLLLAEIGRQNDLKVTSEELGKAMANEARRFPGQEQFVFEYFRNNAEARDALGAPILEDKIVDFILEMAKVNEREVTEEELIQQDQQEEGEGAAEKVE